MAGESAREAHQPTSAYDEGHAAGHQYSNLNTKVAATDTPKPYRPIAPNRQNVQERVRAFPHLSLEYVLINPRSITSGAKSKVKSSVQRAIRSKVIEEYPKLEPYIEDILPKKEQLELVKLYARPHVAYTHTQA
jgi:hypothetical protein